MLIYSVAQNFFKLGKIVGLLRSMEYGMINFTFALPASYTIDTFGRRSLLLITFLLFAIFQLLAAIALMGHEGPRPLDSEDPGIGYRGHVCKHFQVNECRFRSIPNLLDSRLLLS